MPIKDLRQFITCLESADELARVFVETDPILEIAAITDRVCKQPGGGKALLFEQPAGSRFPLATNLFGSPRRVCMALGINHLDCLRERMSSLLGRIPNPGLACLDRRIAALPEFSRFVPTISVDHDQNLKTLVPPDLTIFPFLQSWPGDGAAEGHPTYITLPQVFTAAPDSGNPNCGMYRCQVRGPRELAIRWNPGSGAARHLEEFRNLNKPMPVAIALGGDPAAIFSAMFPLPGDLDEMTFAGFIRGEAVEMTACRTVPLNVPASSEVVIEGYVDPVETVLEGPFGNHTGLYSPAGPAALMRVTAISHRPDAVIPATVVGPPPMEDCWMAKAWERLLPAFLQRFVPAIIDLHFPLEWIFHQSAIISLDNPTPGMVRETSERLWSTPWFGAARLLIFVDADTDASDPSEVAWRGINLSEFSHDLFQDSSGKRLALDATGCRFPRQRLGQENSVKQRVEQRWGEYGIDSSETAGRALAKQATKE